MKTIEQKEANILDKVGNTLTTLDDTLGRMETTESRLKGFVAQEKAIHEVKKAIRESEHYDEISGAWDYDVEADEAYDDKKMGKALVKIDHRLTELAVDLDKLDNDDNSRLKAWFEQRKAIHDVKKILHQADKFEDYREDELSLYM